MMTEMNNRFWSRSGRGFEPRTGMIMNKTLQARKGHSTPIRDQTPRNTNQIVMEHHFESSVQTAAFERVCTMAGVGCNAIKETNR